MSSASREEKLRAYAGQASERLVGAGQVLAARQTMGGPARGNVPPWPGSEDADFHGTLSAIWVWSRAQALSANDHFSLNLAAAWDFVNSSWEHFVPVALGPAASDEAAYDCAMVLRAALADPQILHSDGEDDRRRDRAASAARLLGAYVNDLESPAGREFRDPGFLAWSLGDYARAVGDRGLSSMVRRFVEAAYGMKSPPPFTSEPAAQDGLFDFSCTDRHAGAGGVGRRGPHSLHWRLAARTGRVRGRAHVRATTHGRERLERVRRGRRRPCLRGVDRPRVLRDSRRDPV